MSTVKTETTTSLSSNPVMSLRQPSAGTSEGAAASPQVALLGAVKQQAAPAAAQQVSGTPQTSTASSVSPAVVNKIQQPAVNLASPGTSGATPGAKSAETAKHLEARQAIQQLLAGGKTKQIVIQDPKTGQQHVMHTVQGPDGRNFMLQKAVQGHQGQQLMLQTTKDGQRLVQVPSQPGGQQGRQVIIQTSSGPQQVTLQGAAPSQLTLQTGQVPQTVTLNNSAGQQQVLVHTGPQPRLQAGTKLVQVEEPGARAQPTPSPQPGPSGAQ